MDAPTEVLSQASVFDRLPLVDRLESPKFPSVRDLQQLAGLSSRTSREYGVQVSQGKPTPENVKPEKTIYVKGESESIREPDRPEGAKSGVFFHTHFPTPLQRRFCGIRIPYSKRNVSWYMLPTDIGIPPDFPEHTGGDIIANWSSRILGGYLNITSPYGVSLFAGIRQLTEWERRLDDTQWTLQTGNQAWRTFSARQLMRDSKSIPEDKMLWQHIWPNTDAKYFLTLSWKKLYELESVFGDLHNLCFGDGLAKLLKHLRYDFPSKDNLAMLATNPFIIK